MYVEHNIEYVPASKKCIVLKSFHEIKNLNVMLCIAIMKLKLLVFCYFLQSRFGDP